MVPMKSLVFFGLLLSPIFAQKDAAKDEHPIDLALDKCLETAMTTQAMVECGDQAGRAWKVEMERVYEALLNSLEDQQKNVVVRSQTAWLVFLESEEHTIAALHTDGTISRIDRAFA